MEVSQWSIFVIPRQNPTTLPGILQISVCNVHIILLNKLKFSYFYHFGFKLLKTYPLQQALNSIWTNQELLLPARTVAKKCLNVDGSTVMASQRPTCLETADARKGKASGSQPRQVTMLSVSLVLTLTADRRGVAGTKKYTDPTNNTGDHGLAQYPYQLSAPNG